jgi:hypothetical protein
MQLFFSTVGRLYKGRLFWLGRCGVRTNDPRGDQTSRWKNVYMERNFKPWRIIIYAGPGMALGVALGLLFSMMLFEHAIAGPFTGAAVGAVIGLIWRLQSGRKRAR